MLLALRSLYENAGDVNVNLDGIDLALAVGDFVVTGDANVALDGIDLVLEIGDLQAQLPTSQGGGGWHIGPLGIPTPYVIPQPLPQDCNVELTSIQLKLKVGKLKAKGEHNDLTDDELIAIVLAIADIDEDCDFEIAS